MEIWELCERDFKIDIATFKLGGEAVVFKSYHSRYGDVALKRYQEAFCDDEIKLLKENVYHPNIVRIIGILTDSSTPPKRIGYIMPYMQIGSLDEIIHNKNRSYDDIYTGKQMTNWIIKICCGLSYLHSRKIIHRDIKPSNCGTLFYMAPEIVKSGQYDSSADIYSLSITIWEILHRRIPYDHVSKISDGERPQVNNNLSKEVSDLLTKCWDNDPSKRPTIDYIHDFCRKTTFSFINLENSTNECAISVEHLNVNNNEPLAQIPLKKQSENFHIPNSIEESTEKKTILLVGGINGMYRDSLLMLKNNGQSWEELYMKLPYSSECHGAQFLDNNLYIFGGFGKEGPLNWTYKLSESLQWEKMADMNQKRGYISNSNVILNNQIWVCGGYNREEETLKSVEMYDPLMDKWTCMKQMNKCRKDPAAAVVNGKIFCSGGSGTKNFLDSVECYDPSSDVWTLISDMPQKIMGHSVVEINGHLTIIGGYNGKKYLKNVWTLDTTDKNAIWIEKSSMSILREGFSIAKIDGKIFVCGGYNGTCLDGVEIFDGEVWRDGPEMPNRLWQAPAVVTPTSFARSLN